MPRKTFYASQFKDCQYATAQDKAAWANQFVKFVLSYFDRRHFTNRLYTFLHNNFGHIAHYNIEGFYGTFFNSTRGKIEFLRQTSTYPYHADYYADVCNAVQKWICDRPLIDEYCWALQQEIEAAERAQLARLLEKYGHPSLSEAV